MNSAGRRWPILATSTLSSTRKRIPAPGTRRSNSRDRFLLTVYDAAYVELAQRRALPLATLDRDMQRAGAQLGLKVLGVD